MEFVVFLLIGLIIVLVVINSAGRGKENDYMTDSTRRLRDEKIKTEVQLRNLELTSAYLMAEGIANKKLKREIEEETAKLVDLEIAKETLGRNPSTPVYLPEPDDEILTNVAGVTFDNDDGEKRQDVIRDFCVTGSRIRLEAEPNNPHDISAVAVHLHKADKKIGYIPKAISSDVSYYLLLEEHGLNIRAKVWTIKGGPRSDPEYESVNEENGIIGVDIVIRVYGLDAAEQDFDAKTK